jgi:hypothetical protein
MLKALFCEDNISFATEQSQRQQFIDFINQIRGIDL